MRCLEIIHLRLAGSRSQILMDEIRKSIHSKSDQEIITFYRRSGLDTDLAIHIQPPVLGKDVEKGLGLRLVAVLKSYGLVEHTIWESLE